MIIEVGHRPTNSQSLWSGTNRKPTKPIGAQVNIALSIQCKECAGDHGGAGPYPVQVPGKAKDYRFEKLGLYKCCQGRLPQAEGVTDTLISCRDGVYLQFIRPAELLQPALCMTCMCVM